MTDKEMLVHAAAAPIVATFRNTGGRVFTAEAVAGMVGQRPMLTRHLDWARPLGRAKIVAAELADGEVRLTLELPEVARDAVTPLLEPRAGRLGLAVSVGFHPVRSDAGDDGVRIIDAELLELSPAPDAAEQVVHMAPFGSALLPCCGREARPAFDRTTGDPDLVTCTGR